MRSRKIKTVARPIQMTCDRVVPEGQIDSESDAGKHTDAAFSQGPAGPAAVDQCEKSHCGDCIQSAKKRDSDRFDVGEPHQYRRKRDNDGTGKRRQYGFHGVWQFGRFGNVDAPSGGFEPPTPGLGGRCSIP